MNTEALIDLLKQLEDKRFWGTVKFTIQAGKVEQTEIIQTIKQKVSDQNLLVIISG